MREHRVLEGVLGEDVGERAALAPLLVDGLRGAPGDVQPDRLPDGASAACGTVSSKASATT
jgi:hypothetical protein